MQASARPAFAEGVCCNARNTTILLPQLQSDPRPVHTLPPQLINLCCVLCCGIWDERILRSLALILPTQLCASTRMACRQKSFATSCLLPCYAATFRLPLLTIVYFFSPRCCLFQSMNSHPLRSFLRPGQLPVQAQRGAPRSMVWLPGLSFTNALQTYVRMYFFLAY